MEDKELKLGSLLKKSREEKNLTIKDIQEETKIRKKYLEAIEENNFDILPGTVYLKVFVKGYAREVGLDYQKLLSNYEILKIEEKKETKLNKDFLDGNKVSYVSKNNKKKINPLKIILFILIALFLTAAAIYSYQYFSEAEIRLLNQKNSEQQSKKNINNKEQKTPAVEKEEADNLNKKLNDKAANKKTVNIDLLTDSDNQAADSTIKNDLQSFMGLSDKQIDINEKSEIIIPKDGVSANNTKIKTEEELLEAAAQKQNIKLEDESLKSIFNSENNLAAENDSDLSQNIDNEKDDSASIIVENDENNFTENKDGDKLNNSAAAAEKILIKADDTVWVTIDVDNNNVFSGILESSDQLDFEFKESIYIKIGNGSAITAEIGKEEFGPWAAGGQIAEVEIIKEEGQIIVKNLRN